MKTALWRKCPDISGATYGAAPMVIMWTISTSCNSGARRISASTSVSGSAHPGWMYTRIPDATQLRAWSAVCNFLVYECSQDIVPFVLLTSLARFSCLCECVLCNRPLIAHGRVVNRPVEELIQPFEHLNLAKHFYRTLKCSFLLDELPKVLFGQNNRPNELAERDMLQSTAGTDLQVPCFHIPLVLGHQPIAQMPVDLKDALFQLFAWNILVASSGF